MGLKVEVDGVWYEVPEKFNFRNKVLSKLEHGTAVDDWASVTLLENFWFTLGTPNKALALTPGKHKLALQFADDLHNAIKGMCSEISVNVAP